MRYILRQKTRPTQSRVSEVLVDDGATQRMIKRGKQSSLANRIDGSLQTRRLLSGKSTRIRQSPRRRAKRARNSDGEIARLRDKFENDDDVDADDVWSNAAGSRGLPVWQVPEPPIATTNSVSTTTATVTRMESPEIPNSDRSSRTGDAILPLIHSNRQETFTEATKTRISNWENQNGQESEVIFPPRKPIYVLSYPDRYTDVIDGSFAFPRTSSRHFPDSEPLDVKAEDTGSRARNSVSGVPIEKVLLPVYRLGIPPPGHQETLPGSHSNNKDTSQVKNNRAQANSFRRFLLVPVSKDLYVLKDADEDIRPRTSEDTDNTTSTVLAFKAHLHHDAKDAGKEYLQGRLLKHQHRLSDHETNHSYSDLEYSTAFQEEDAEKSTLYPNFLYPEITSQTYPEMSDEEIALQTADPGLSETILV